VAENTALPMIGGEARPAASGQRRAERLGGRLVSYVMKTAEGAAE
jgi:hypothetical protein